MERLKLLRLQKRLRRLYGHIAKETRIDALVHNTTPLEFHVLLEGRA